MYSALISGITQGTTLFSHLPLELFSNNSSNNNIQVIKKIEKEGESISQFPQGAAQSHGGGAQDWASLLPG